MTSPRRDWSAILAQAADIVVGYETGVTLRQLFYRLVAAEILPNTRAAYSTLSSRTAEARRQGTFPDLIDRTRRIHRVNACPEVAFGAVVAQERADASRLGQAAR